MVAGIREQGDDQLAFVPRPLGEADLETPGGIASFKLGGDGLLQRVHGFDAAKFEDRRVADQVRDAFAGFYFLASFLYDAILSHPRTD